MIPNLLTAVGLFAGVLGLVLGLEHGWPLLALSLLLDVADGYAARRLGQVTKLGRLLDWQTDCALAVAGVWALLPPSSAAAATAGLVLVQAEAIRSHVRFSGRALTWALLALLYAGGLLPPRPDHGGCPSGSAHLHREPAAFLPEAPLKSGDL